MGWASYAQVHSTRGHQRTLDFFEMRNEHLKDREYVATGDYTLADISAQVVVDFAAWIKAVPGEEQTALISWRQRMADRPSASA